ncbi:MAG: peptide chain release factor N(5)-glutamine methyltransferase [Alphaproteobacteria bacterium]
MCRAAESETRDKSAAIPRTAQEAIVALTADFRANTLPSPELDARLLVLDACGISLEAYHLRPARALSATEAERIDNARKRRLAREPVSRILGYREFWGRRFAISPAVLDPRPDTETLIETALEILHEEGRSQAPLRILDLGAGSGCILITLLAELPNAWGLGLDRSPDALAIAQKNAAALGVADRCSFTCANWLDALAPQSAQSKQATSQTAPFDLVVSNPPYISEGEIAALAPEVRSHDPRLALTGGPSGLDAYRAIIETTGSVIAQNGWLLLESGAGQVAEILNLLSRSNWTATPGSCTIRKDIAGIERVVAVKRQPLK